MLLLCASTQMRLKEQKESQGAGHDPEGSPVKASISSDCVRFFKEQQQTGEVHLHSKRISCRTTTCPEPNIDTDHIPSNNFRKNSGEELTKSM